jgi:hypothetical protein
MFCLFLGFIPHAVKTFGRFIYLLFIFQIGLNALFSGRVHAQEFISGRKPFVTQMHIHGWSNHNGATKPGSHQYHNWQADSSGVQVLWWAEHHPMYRQDTLLLPLAGGTIDPVTLDVRGLSAGSQIAYDRWKCLSREGDAQVSLQGDTLSFSLTAVSFGSADIFSFAPRSQDGFIKSLSFVKPLASLPKFQFKCNADVPPSDAALKIIARLSWHYRQQEGQDVLIFNLKPTGSFSISTNNVDTVWIVVPVSAGWQTVELDLMQAASYLDHGVDNTLSDIELRLTAQDAAIVVAGFHDFKLIPQQMSSDSIISAEKVLLEEYSNHYHSQNLLGVEYSGPVHLNGYFPAQVSDSDIFEGRGGSAAAWVNLIHNAGGVVSYNHVFGTDWNVDPVSVQEFRSDTLANYLLQHNAFGADIIEVGYLSRGGGNLEHHLLTWDKLTANRLFLYGNGVSDSHGSLWMDKENLFHTSIWSTDSSDFNLLESLSLGKMFFSIHQLFQGEFFYSVANLEMGDRGFSNVAAAVPDFHIVPFPAGGRLKFTQGLLDTSLQVNYLHHNAEIDPANPFPIDLTQPCFIRYALYDAADRPLAFGQPIVILGNTGDFASPQMLLTEGIQMQLFPNPASTFVELQFDFGEAGTYKLRMLNAEGKEVKVVDERYYYKGRYGYSVDVREFSRGVYFFELVSSGSRHVARFIRN